MHTTSIFAVLLLLVAVSRGTPISEDSEVARHGSFNMYYIYTRENAREPVRLLPTAESVFAANSTFRGSTAIVVHGHEGTAFSSLNPVVKDAFLTHEDITVIVIDWSTYAGQSYINAVNAVPGVAGALAELIELLVGLNRVSLDSLHLVGFDLGAHVVGFTGRHLGGEVARITGLDPTGSQWGSNSQRLRPTDARYVEVIHTDGNGLFSSGVGTALGDVDFFANGGGSQPGCITNACSHNRAWEIFAATLTHNHLIGNLCSTNLELSTNRCRGFALAVGNNEFNKFGSGIYRVNTRRTYPY